MHLPMPNNFKVVTWCKGRLASVSSNESKVLGVCSALSSIGLGEWNDELATNGDSDSESDIVMQSKERFCTWISSISISSDCSSPGDISLCKTGAVSVQTVLPSLSPWGWKLSVFLISTNWTSNSGLLASPKNFPRSQRPPTLDLTMQAAFLCTQLSFSSQLSERIIIC